MEYIYDINNTSCAKVTNRCQMSMVQYVFKKLDSTHQELFKKSCFGHLLKIDNEELKLASQIIHGLLRRTVKSSANNGVWFNINDKLCRFGLQEFAIVTGLKVADESVEYRVEKGRSSVMELLKNEEKGKITRGDLFEKFNEDGVEPGLKYKLGLLTVLTHVISAVELDSDVDERWIYLVEDLEKFNNYPWGNLSYKHTVKIFKRKVNLDGEHVSYSVHGFPLAIMIWALEAHPKLRKKSQAKFTPCPPKCPRINGWRMKKQLRRETVDMCFNGVEDVQCTLDPNNDEVEAPYLKDLTMSGDKEKDDSNEEEGASSDDENDDACSDDEERDGDEKKGTFLPSKKGTFVPSTSNSDGDRPFVSKSIEQVVRTVVKEEMVSFFEKIDMKMDKFMESIKREILRSNGKEDETKEKESDEGPEMEGVGTFRDTKVDNEIDDTCGGVEFDRDDERLGVNNFMRPESEDEVLVEDCFSDDEVSPMIPKKNEVEINQIGSGLVSTAKNSIVVHRNRKLDKLPMNLAFPESPKGRGCRIKRKTAIMVDPWTNPGKRMKFDNVKVYDPFRVVDPAKLDDLNKWLSNGDSVEDHKVDLKCCHAPVGKAFFNKIIDVQGWLTDEHVDAALFLIRERAVTHPGLFRQDCAILDSSFVPYVRMYFKQLQKGKSSEHPEFPNALVRFVQGEIPKFGKSWNKCRMLYFPFCNEKMTHWIALEIDLTERCIRAHDSMTSVMGERKFEREMEPLRVVIPMLMQLAVGDENYNLEKFELMRPKSPIQTNGSDCGMFTIKFIEFLQGRKDVKDVEGKSMSLWREKLAAEIFADHFDP